MSQNIDFVYTNYSIPTEIFFGCRQTPTSVSQTIKNKRTPEEQIAAYLAWRRQEIDEQGRQEIDEQGLSGTELMFELADFHHEANRLYSFALEAYRQGVRVECVLS